MIGKAYQYVTSTGYGALNDNDGRIRKITDNLDGNYTTTYSYDEHNRLTSAQSNAAARSYSYDAWGNLKQKWGDNGGTSIPTQTYNLPNNGTGVPATNQINSVTVGSTL
jgi:YD repeat-containing protein